MRLLTAEWVFTGAVLTFGTATAIRAGRAATLAWLDRLAQVALCIGIGALARHTLGEPLGYVVVPPVGAAIWFGSTTLGMLNFLVWERHERIRLDLCKRCGCWACAEGWT